MVGADSVPKKLGDLGECAYVGYYVFSGNVSFTPDVEFTLMIITNNTTAMVPNISNNSVSWGGANATILNKSMTFFSKHQGGVDVTKTGNTYTWNGIYYSTVVLLK